MATARAKAASARAGVEPAIEAQDAQAGAEALLWVGTVVEDGDDQPLGLRADAACPAPDALGAPLSVASMRAGHVRGIGAVALAGVAAFVGGDALTAVEHLDGAR